METEQTTETFEERIAALDELEGLKTEAVETLSAILLHRKFTAGPETVAEIMAVVDSFELRVTCGDCIEGRCHWGGEQSRAGIAAVAADPEHDRPCGCRLHATSYAYRLRRKQLREAGVIT